MCRRRRRAAEVVRTHIVTPAAVAEEENCRAGETTCPVRKAVAAGHGRLLLALGFDQLLEPLQPGLELGVLGTLLGDLCVFLGAQIAEGFDH